MFKIRLLQEKDYEQLLVWWKWFRFPAPPKEMLPENALGGVMVYENDINICAGFIYFTNSKMCWIEFIISNPEYKHKDRKLAVKLVIDSLCHLAKENSCKVAFTSVKNQSLLNIYLENGFNNNGLATEMTKLL